VTKKKPKARVRLKRRVRPLPPLSEVWNAAVAVEQIRKQTLDPRSLSATQRAVCVDYMASELVMPIARIARILACDYDTARRDLTRINVQHSVELRATDARDDFLGDLLRKGRAAYHVAARKNDAHGMVAAAKMLRDVGADLGLLDHAGVSPEETAAAAVALVQLAAAGAAALAAGPPPEDMLPDYARLLPPPTPTNGQPH
jgi:hypothetical protein